MPTYEYRCPNGHEFEEFFRTISSAATELKCPTCGALAPRQVSGGGGLVFKGSGFYITDYRSDSYKKAAAAETGSSSAEPSKGASSDKGGAAGSTRADPKSTPGSKAGGKGE